MRLSTMRVRTLGRSALSQNGRNWAIASLLMACSLGLPGCGGIDGIELNGKLFDAVGLSADSFKKTEPKAEARAPLVLPPDGTRLPEPGSIQQPAPTNLAAGTAWPMDPEQKKLADAEAKKKAHEELCKNGNWKENAVKDERQQAQSNCGNSLFSFATDAITGNKK